MKRQIFITIIILSINSIHASWEPGEFDRKSSKSFVELKKYCGVEELYDGLSFAGSTNVISGYLLILSAFGDTTMKKASKVGTASLLSAQAATLLLKTATNRDRPKGESEKPWKSSFPSGHTSSAFAFAYTFGHYYPKFRIPLFIFASSVGISRIGLEAHWTTDVIAGAFVGIASGIISIKLSEKILKFHLK